MNATSVAGELAARNATEQAILDAARAAISDEGYDALTMNGLAQRAFVSRTNLYFYFANKRAVLDHLVKQTFAEMLVAGAAYLDGAGDPRRELRESIAGVVAVVNRDQDVLILATRLSGAEDRLPVEWEPYITAFVAACARRIEADQQRGVAPDDIDAALSARALCAMVERHLLTDVIRGGTDVNDSIRTLAELWYRAAYLAPSEQ